jgi:hypothetical protein
VSDLIARDPGGRTELRPSGRSYGRAVLPVVPLVVVVGVLKSMAHGDSVWTSLVIVGAVLVVGVVAVLWYARAERVWTDARAVYRRGLLGRVKVVERSRIASVLLATQYTGPNRRTGALLSLLDGDGRSLMRLLGPIWGTEDVVGFVGAAALTPVLRIDEPVTAADLRADHPGALPYADRRPVKLFLLTMAATVVVIALVLVVVGVVMAAVGGS